MAVTSRTRQKKRPAKAKAAVSESWQNAVCRQFAKVAEIDAVFALEDNKITQIFSVVREFDDSVYEKLLKKERSIEKAFPEISFDFHVRAHQGRKPNLAVPFGSEVVFDR